MFGQALPADPSERGGPRSFLGVWRSSHFESRVSVRLCTGLRYAEPCRVPRRSILNTSKGGALVMRDIGGFSGVEQGRMLEC